jgi:hypothetical protein
MDERGELYSASAHCGQSAETAPLEQSLAIDAG